jgi:hypothetical protein
MLKQDVEKLKNKTIKRKLDAQAEQSTHKLHQNTTKNTNKNTQISFKNF